ncbi:hypothetical protein ACFVZ8_18945 [Streptomyces sp. NPDC059558]|uniref:hypothetical protein n=1 Tax=Streptomyces sp. NPDC059558 TaxID=3346864 RepID=UPI00368B166D
MRDDNPYLLSEINEKLDGIMLRLDQMGDQVVGLDERFHEVLARWTHYREDLTGSHDEMHRAIAQDLHSFVCQKLLRLAYMRSRAAGSTPTGRQTAQLVSALCVSYLGPAEIDLSRVRRMLKARKGDECWQAAGQAALQAKKIFAAARAQGAEFSWDYDYSQGFPLDEERQQVWSNCDPEADVSFVVVPGYVADGEYYLLQQVFTKTVDSGI